MRSLQGQRDWEEKCLMGDSELGRWDDWKEGPSGQMLGG